jgi:hypothetical protein
MLPAPDCICFILTLLASLPVEWSWTEEFQARMEDLYERGRINTIAFEKLQHSMVQLLIRDFMQCTQRYMTVIERRKVGNFKLLHMKHESNERAVWKIQLNGNIFKEILITNSNSITFPYCLESTTNCYQPKHLNLRLSCMTYEERNTELQRIQHRRAANQVDADGVLHVDKVLQKFKEQGYL